jgi:thiosulfate dehydrogenase [quinone] large subunit
MSSFFQRLQPKTVAQIPESTIAKFLFADTRMALVWLVVRVYIGWQWLVAGVEKLTGTSIDIGTFGQKTGSAWVFNDHAGAAIKGFASYALTKANGDHPDVQGWYAWFLQHVVISNSALFAYLITFGEIAVGLGLIFGVLTGIAAFFGVAMNFNYLLAGTVSINPLLGVLALFVLLAWRVAGFYGVDRYLLPMLGTPWTGSLVKHPVAQPEPAHVV